MVWALVLWYFSPLWFFLLLVCVVSAASAVCQISKSFRRNFNWFGWVYTEITLLWRMLSGKTGKMYISYPTYPRSYLL